jgi:hypothetical protein
VPHLDLAGLGEEPLRVLRIDPQLDGVPGRGERVQVDARRLAGRYPDLLGDQVHAVHRLGDRVLDLQPGVHLEEVEPAADRVEQELHRPRAAVADGLGGAHGGGAHPFAQFGSHRG